jgi:CHRD domain-containing protein
MLHLDAQEHFTNLIDIMRLSMSAITQARAWLLVFGFAVFMAGGVARVSEACDLIIDDDDGDMGGMPPGNTDPEMPGDPANIVDFFPLPPGLDLFPEEGPGLGGSFSAARRFTALLNLSGGGLPASGFGRFVLSSDGTTLDYRVFVRGFPSLGGSVTGVHFHDGANGPIVQFFNFGYMGPSIAGYEALVFEGSLSPTPHLVDELLAGKIFFDVRIPEPDFPNRAVVGQLVAQTPEPSSIALFSAATLFVIGTASRRRWLIARHGSANSGRIRSR